MKKNFLWMIIVLFCAVSCKNSKNTVIEGMIMNAEESVLYLYKVTSAEMILLDSTVVSKEFFKFEIDEVGENMPHFYQLSFSNVNAMVTVASAGEKVEIMADGNNLAKTYNVKGNEDAVLLWQLDQMLKYFIAEVDELYAQYETFIENDTVRARIEQIYLDKVDLYETSLKEFIQANSQSIVSITAFYQTYNNRRFIEEAKNILLLQSIYDQLSIQYPEHDYVQYIKQRIEIEGVRGE